MGSSALASSRRLKRAAKSKPRDASPPEGSKHTNPDIISFVKSWEWVLPDVTITSGFLANKADVQASNMSAYLKKTRTMPVSAAIRLAKGVAAPGTPTRNVIELAKTLRQMSSEEKVSDWPDDYSLCVEDRMHLGLAIRVALVVSEPFVFPNGEGFAVDVYNLLRGLLGVAANIQPATFGDLQRLFKAGEIDLVVSATLPTFRRQQFMDFTIPLPFLSISLGGVVTSGVNLTSDDVLEWNQKAKDFLNNNGRILVAKGEVGDEFCLAFLNSVNLYSQVEKVDHLDPAALLERMTGLKRPVLLLADNSTCKAILASPAAEGKVESLKPGKVELSKEKEVESPESGKADFGELASYPVAFGIPKGDSEWKTLINTGMEALKNEGVCKLVAIYQKYIKGEHGLQIKDFITPVDPLVNPRQREYFLPALKLAGKLSGSCPACHRPLETEQTSAPATAEGEQTR